MIGNFFRDETGATPIEYGAIGALLSIAVVTGAHMIGISVGNFLAPIKFALN